MNKLSFKENWIEILSASLLALATIGSAWSAYQASRWGGLQAISYNEANAARAETIRLTNVISRKIMIDVGLFVRFAAAISENNQKLADFLKQRFRPPLREATDAWLAMQPLQNPDAPPSPFNLDIYVLPEEQELDLLSQKSEEQIQMAKQANQNGDNYILLTVLFATVLFFSGVGTKYKTFLIKVFMLGGGAIIFLTAVTFLIIYPVY